MSEASEYVERQEDELEFLQAVFPNPGDFQDLRRGDTWKVKSYYHIILIEFSNYIFFNCIIQLPCSI